MRTRPAQPKAEEPRPGNSLVASAARVSGGNTDYSKAAKIASEPWQELAWGFYRSVGEFRFACDWVGSMLSKAVLFAQQDTGTGPKKKTTGTAAEYVARLAGDEEGRAELLQQIGIHFTVAGECYIVGTVNEWDEDEYVVYAATALTKRGDKWYVKGREIKTTVGDPLVIRLWKPDPVDPKLAHAPARAMLPILAEIEGLTKHVSAQIDSRLAGAGILWVPNEMEFPAKPVVNPDGSITMGTSGNLSEFVTMLQEVMATAIQNREDASALVPIVIKAPGEMIQYVQHMTFWSELDRQAVELRNEAIRRLALGMDMPPEVLLGVADTNHWAAWAADESAIKAHTEPLLKIITRSLTVGYLRPVLRDDGEDNVRFWGIGVDTSQMRLRPNRSKEAMELYEHGELSAAATRREMGFSEDDAPKKDEVALWLTRKIASGSTTPEQVAWAAKELGVPLPAPVEETVEPTEARPEPSIADHPVQELPEEAASVIRLEAAAEQMVYRALERAGNRMRNKMQRKVPGVSAADTYLYVAADTGSVDDYLDDAFSGVNRFAPSLGIDADRLSTVLDTYCRMLITERKPHDQKVLSAYLNLARMAAA